MGSPDRASKYHQPLLELLGVRPVLSAERLAAVEERERVCGVRFPSSVREWFAVEGVEKLFHDNTNEDHLEDLAELGRPEETAQGYLRVAVENQGVVGWYVRLDEGEDPPVYDNNDDWGEDLSRTDWQKHAAMFTAFVFDMVASNRFGGWYSGMHLSAEDRLPTEHELSLLEQSFRRGPETDTPDVRAYRFFDVTGVITVRSVGDQLGSEEAQWSVEAASPEALLHLAQKLFRIGTLARTLKAESSGAETRAKADEVLKKLRRGSA